MKNYFFLLLLFLLSTARAQIITTVAGNGSPAGPSPDGVLATSVVINAGAKIVSDTWGNLYIGGVTKIRKVDAITGIITTVAGTNASGFYGDGGPATQAKLSGVGWIAIDNANNLYLGDSYNYRIRKVNAVTGYISTIAGNGNHYYSGDNGPAISCSFSSTIGIAVDISGNIYVADSCRVRKIDVITGEINNYVGTSPGYFGDGGQATVAQINQPQGICIDVYGNLYITDPGPGNYRVRKVNSLGIISTYAGSGTYSYSGDGIPATIAQISPEDVATDISGNLYISDNGNNRVRMVDLAGIIHTVAGNGTAGYTGDGMLATSAELNFPEIVSIGHCDDNLYIGDFLNNRIRKVALTSAPAYCTCVPTDSITALPRDTVCSGTAVTFFATVTNAGLTTTFNWLVNGVLVSTTGSSYTYVPSSGDAIRCDITTSGGACLSTVTVSSNTIHMVAKNSIGPIDGDLALCIGDTKILSDTSSGGVWNSDHTAIAVIGSATGIITGRSAGTAIISYSLSCGMATATVTVNATPAAISGVKTVCAGNASTLTDAITGGSWSSSNTVIAVIGSANGIYSGITGGTATISYTISGCSAVDANVTVDAAPSAIIGATGICTGTNTVLSDATLSGVWSSNNTVVATIGSASGIVTGVSAGTAVISYTAAGGCSVAVIVTVSATVPSINGVLSLCVGNTTALSNTAAGGTWSSSNTSIAVINTTGIVNGIAAGIAIITYSLGVGCMSTATLTVYALPDSGTITGFATICKGSAFTLNETATGGTWTSSNTLVATIVYNSGSVSALAAGTTIITYTTGPNAGGCTSSATFILKVAPPFTLTGNASQLTCYGNNNGSITAIVNGGTGPYRFAWATGDTSSAINNLVAGTYSLTVKDLATQCGAADSFILNQPDSLVTTADVKNDTCKSGNGSIGITVAGGTAPYYYQWSNNATGANISNLSAGTYVVTITDLNNCKKTLPVIVDEDSCVDVIVRTGLSPNGDGINDTWVIEGLQKYPENMVQVYDKFGDMVFEQSGYNNDWGGKGIKGALVPDGTYYYLVKLNAKNESGGKNVFTGSLMIKR